jgi:hypothetical protein
LLFDVCLVVLVQLAADNYICFRKLAAGCWLLLLVV